MSDQEPSFISTPPPPTLGQWLNLFYKLVTTVVQVASLPFEVVLRRQMGVRQLSPVPILASFYLIMAFGAVSTLATQAARALEAMQRPRTTARTAEEQFGWYTPNQGKREEAPQSPRFDLAFLALALIYIIAVLWQVHFIVRRREQGIRCHSRYWGDSWPIWSRLPFFPGQYYWQFIFEPAGLIGMGLIVRTMHTMLGAFILCGGVGLFIKHYIAHRKFMGSVLDAVDAQIESRWASEYMSQWREPGAVTTEGFVVPPFIQKRSNAEKLQYFATTARLDPKLQELLRRTVKSEGGQARSQWIPVADSPDGPDGADDGTRGHPFDQGDPRSDRPHEGASPHGRGGSLLTSEGPKLPTLAPWSPSDGGSPPVPCDPVVTPPVRPIRQGERPTVHPLAPRHAKLDRSIKTGSSSSDEPTSGKPGAGSSENDTPECQ